MNCICRDFSMKGAKIIAIVGMPGSGKTEAAHVFKEVGFPIIRFGDITDAELARRGLERNERNERLIREELRQKLGMAAYAILSIPLIERAAASSPLVVLDGLYSWAEYTHLKKRYGDSLCVLAIVAPRALRHARLMRRPVRPLTREECESRDQAEIENLEKGGPIAAADVYILNDGTIEEFRKKIRKVMAKF